MPRVSIILPTYNGEKYLCKSIESILAQTCRDWELILVDDCSTDKTAGLADMFARRDARIQVIHNERNLKLPGALNAGFSLAKGEYLTWTSDDNLYLPDAIEVMTGCLDRYKDVYMVRTSMFFMNEEGCITGEAETYDDRKMYDHNCMGACFMYRREVRDEIGDYDTTSFCVEDYDYWLRVLKRFGSVLPIDQVLYRYRRHGGSLSERKKAQVREQLTRLRLRNLDSVLENLQGDQAAICRIYYEMRQTESMTQEAVNRFRQVLPVVCGEVLLEKYKRYIIFGAGVWGERAAKRLGDAAAFFVDSDPEKTGKRKCGRKILSFQEAVCLAGEYGFLIAVAEERIYEMMMQLQIAGIREYSVFVTERNRQEFFTEALPEAFSHDDMENTQN